LGHRSYFIDSTCRRLAQDCGEHAADGSFAPLREARTLGQFIGGETPQVQGKGIKISGKEIPNREEGNSKPREAKSKFFSSAN
jgi:hypothetical protein